MRIKILISVLFLLGFKAAIAQEYYYWAYGKKLPLEINTKKNYILTLGLDREMIANELGLLMADVTDMQKLLISESVENKNSTKTRKEGLKWGFVNRFVDHNKKMSSGILYTAPTFIVNDNEIFLSQFFYVKLKDKDDAEILEEMAQQNKVQVIGNNKFMPLWYTLSCDKNSTGNSLELANKFYESGKFAIAQPDFMSDFNTISTNCVDDDLFAQQWHLNNTGQAGGTLGNDISICEAWDITMGCDDIVVAIVDHGLEFNHPDFNNISTISYDCETGTVPSVVRGNHAVEVAGVIAATANNTIGVAGVAPNIQLMSISNTMELSPLLSERLADGINFAWQNGADVINNSWGSNSITQQQFIDDAIDLAVTQGRGGLGTIVVFGTGNDAANTILYPSINENVIAVGAIGRNPSRASFSNYGAGLDLVAPGVSITMTDRQGVAGDNNSSGTAGNYVTRNGTSFAAPQVSGVAALILSLNPSLNLQEVRDIIEGTTDKAGNYTYSLGTGEQPGLTWNNQMGYGRLNAYRALQAAMPSISGASVVCNSEIFQIDNLPPGSTVTWTSTWNSPPYPTLIQNSPAANQCTINNTYQYPSSTTLTATIIGSCETIVLTKVIGSDYNNLTQYGSYNQPACWVNGLLQPTLSGSLPTNPYSATYLHQGGPAEVTLSQMGGKTVTYVGSPPPAPQPTFWYYNSTTNKLTVQLPLGSGGVPFTFKISGEGVCQDKTRVFFSYLTYYNYYNFNISQNPVNDVLIVNAEVNEGNVSKAAETSVIDNLQYTTYIYDQNSGILLDEQKSQIGCLQHHINVKKLKTGAYVLKISLGNEVKTIRFIKQ